MRRAIIPLVALALASFAGQAAAEQGSWQPRLSLYSGQFYSIAFASATTVWAAGPGGILLSEDGGASWRWAVNTPLRAVDSAGDGAHGWAVGAGGAIFATSDGGRTWAQQQSGTDLDLDAVGALDSRHAVATGYTAGGPHLQPLAVRTPIYTDDGGLTWQRGRLPRQYSLDSLSVLKRTSKAWASAVRCTPEKMEANGCVGEDVLLASDDAGKTWAEIGSGQTLWSLQFTSASTGWAIGGTALVRTNNGGRSWRVVRDWTSENVSLSDMSALGDDRVVLMETDLDSSSQQIIKTIDAGATWTDVGGTLSFTTDLRYFDERHAVRSSVEQRVQWSDDGGVTWRPTSTPVFATRFRLTVDFVDPVNGWAAATKLLRTRDGGSTWEAVSDQQFDSLDFISSTEGWATQTVCLAGPCESIVFHSVDGGATWVEQVRHEASNTPHVAFVDRLNGWVTLGRGKPVLHTRDGGYIWSEQEPPGGRLTFVDAMTVWSATDPAATGGGAVSVYLSRDGGDSWSPAGNLLSQNCWPEVMAAADAAHAWFVSPDCVHNPRAALLRTVDGGATWQEVSPMSNGTFEHLAFFTPIDGVAVETVCPRSPVSSNSECQSQLLRTRDGGYTWTIAVTTPSTGTLKDYLFTDLWHGWQVDTLGGGMTEVQSQTVSTYSATTSFVVPDSGEGHGSALPTIALAALGVFGAVFVGLGGLARLRRRRHNDTGG